MKKLFLVFLTSLVLFQCKKTPTIEIGQNAFISATVLNARKTPTLDGEKVGKLKLGDQVKVLERSEKDVEIDGISAYWYRVQSPTITGWVFGGYLSITKVESREAMIAAVQGNFVFCTIPDRLDCSHTIEFDGESFIYREFNQYSGISEKLEGVFDVYSDHLVLDTKSRLVRPSIFIQFPQTEEERTAYNNAYFGYSDSDEHLVSLSTYPVAGKLDLYFYVCNDKLSLLKEKKEIDSACKTEYAFTKSSYSSP
ncbi:SH3 domain-containing protein [Leptospira congkakensis]|uniref:SH3 domain-containing protein n=1 Tax=Leptospira congkakensis TaxID=2484932 RepID=A0A4Z1AE87_9LEPT|nr:SH3 domain-containing protein [Leptospira congkakensis]TGL90775.1 SH3 domain-containing protein [Leptospira congkakensis]TGL91782.1 SH3 domain-containing protein [Leptospira congkakensis]TGL98835.1 SH3 domain-containing protein [Leptospira congkakensis]